MNQTTARTRRPLLIAVSTVASLAVLGSGLSACSTDQAEGSAETVVQKEAGPFGIPSVVDFVAQTLLGDAASSAAGGLFGLLTGAGDGVDPNAEKFDELSGQLTEVQESLVQVQASVDTLISKATAADYAADLRDLQEYGDDVQAFYESYFLPVTAANQKLLDDKATGKDDATLENDRAAVKSANDNFASVYRSNFGVEGSLASKIHNYLVPGATSVLDHKGAELMNKGYITWTDSEQLRAEYDIWSEYQAAAALMLAYNTHLTNQNPAAATEVLAKWEARRDAEMAALPPMMGAGVVIATPNGTTNGATVYTPNPNATQYTWQPVFNGKQLGNAVSPDSGTSTGSLGPHVDNLSGSKANGNKLELNGEADWALWSDKDAAGLAKAIAKVPGATVGVRLSNLAAAVDPGDRRGLQGGWTSLADGSYLWTTGKTSLKTPCGYFNSGAASIFGPPWETGDYTSAFHNALDLKSSDGTVTGRTVALNYPFANVGDRDTAALGKAACIAEGTKQLVIDEPTAGAFFARIATAEENYMAE